MSARAIPTVLRTTPIAMPAHLVFSPAEHEARLEAMTELAQRRIPLDRIDQPDGPDEDIYGQCWGCGIRSPVYTEGPYKGRRMYPQSAGWHVGPRSPNGYRRPITEVWCPSCAAMLEEDEDDE